MNFTRPIFALALFSSLVVAPVQASGLIDATDPGRILQIAKGFGSAELTRDSTGDPFITGRMDGIKYGIFFYGCEKGRDCDDIEFVASWTKTGATLDKLNEWNANRRYGTAFIDKDGDVGLKMTTNIDYGVSKKNLEDSFDWWGKAMKAFLKDVLGQ